MLEPIAGDCFNWLMDHVVNNTMTLEQMNDVFTSRNLGGIIFISVLMVTGLFGNLVVLWIYGRKFKRSNYRTYTIWLAAIDLTNCCIGMPFLLVYHTHYVTFPSLLLCKLGRFVLLYTGNASSLLLVVIGVDRYRRVCHPLKQQISKTQAIVACCVMAFIAVAISWPNLMLFGIHNVTTLPFNQSGPRCWADDDFRDGNTLRDFYIGMCCFSFAVTVVLVICYGLIVRFLFKSETIGTPIQAKKITFTLFIVTLAYVLSALPHNIIIALLLQFPTLHCYMSFEEGFALYIFVWSNLLNNSVNPFIYGISDARFKKELKEMFSYLTEKIKNVASEI